MTQQTTNTSQANWRQVLGLIGARKEVPAEGVRFAMDQIMTGQAVDAQVAAFAFGIFAKGITAAELDAAATGMLSHAADAGVPDATGAVDIVGTGGDGAHTVNISTMSSVVVAASGTPVLKHGNRAASSACGTADCLEELGVVLDLDPAVQGRVFDEAGIVFLFASHYHPSLRHAAVPRRELGIRTTFNFLGPLANPARPLAQAIGVADRQMAELVASVLADRGNRGLVFHGGDGLDELTTTTTSDVWVVGGGRVVRTTLDPLDLGIPRTTKDSLVGGGPPHNAQVVRDTFAGQPGPVRDIVLLNAAAAILAFEGPDPDADLAGQLVGPLERAAAAVDSGAATAVLERWVALTRDLAA